MRGLRAAYLVGGCFAGIAACTVQEASNRDSATGGAMSRASGGGRVWNPDTWQAPVVDSTPDDQYATAVYRGLAIITHTADSLPGYVGSNLNCTSCHLDEGRRANAIPLAGSFARYPRYMDRTAAVIPVEDRINYCFTRSLSGSKLPSDSREMQDIVAYLSYISRGVPYGEHVRGEGMPKMPPFVGDSGRGGVLFAQNCTRCHGSDGEGMGPIPALWGARAFSVGASMARQERAAAFIRRNMPFDAPGTLNDRQSYDIAAYMTSMPRPDSPGKENDWPSGGAPPDVPYATRGHRAYRPPRLLARTANPGAAIVTAPTSVPRQR